ncbi:unnamed protein product [Discosporangium mesarthrocarpum]
MPVLQLTGLSWFVCVCLFLSLSFFFFGRGVCEFLWGPKKERAGKKNPRDITMTSSPFTCCCMLLQIVLQLILRTQMVPCACVCIFFIIMHSAIFFFSLREGVDRVTALD